MLDYLTAIYAGHDQLEDCSNAEELEHAAALLAAMAPGHGLVKALRHKVGRMRTIAQLLHPASPHSPGEQGR